MQFSKLECAEHFLDAACDVYARHGPCPAVLHLAGAAAEVAAGVSEHRKIFPDGESQSLLAAMKKDNEKYVSKMLSYRNWIKHTNKPHEIETDLDWPADEPRGRARAAQVFMQVAAIEIANMNDRASMTTWRVAHVLRPLAPDLAEKMDWFIVELAKSRGTAPQ